MIKLSNILNEIRLIPFKRFSKDINWKYKVNNEEELNRALNYLDILGYKWMSGVKMFDYKSISDYYPRVLIHSVENPGKIKIGNYYSHTKYDGLINEIKLVPDILSKIKSKLASFKNGDKVKYTVIDGEVIEGKIRGFKSYDGKDGILLIRTPGKYFHRDSSIYIDVSNQFNNRTSNSFWTLQKI